MQIKHRWWIAGATAAALTLVVSAGAVMAQTPSGTATPPADGTPTTSTTPQSQTPPSEQTPGSGDEAKPDGGMRGVCGLKGASLTELATFLGTDEKTLRTELQADGATLASVAAAHGQSRDALVAFLTERVQAHLEEKVAEGDLTQEEADARLAEFTANVGERIDAEGGLRFGGRHERMRGGAAADNDSTPSSESSS